jgi:hypothetical protein
LTCPWQIHYMYFVHADIVLIWQHLGNLFYEIFLGNSNMQGMLYHFTPNFSRILNEWTHYELYYFFLHLGRNHWAIHTKWGSWSPCSICGDKKYGERRRQGTCRVTKLRNGQVRPKKLAEILWIYRLATPCHASMFYRFQKVTSRPEQIEIQKCHVKCMHNGKKYRVSQKNVPKIEVLHEYFITAV